MTYHIIDRFLPEKKFLIVKNKILNPEFTWNLVPKVSDTDESLKITSSYYFTHMFYSGFFVDQIVIYLQTS